MLYIISPQAFYTLKGIQFHKPIIRSVNHTGVKDPLLSLLRQQFEGEPATPKQQSQNCKSSNLQLYRTFHLIGTLYTTYD